MRKRSFLSFPYHSIDYICRVCERLAQVVDQVIYLGSLMTDVGGYIAEIKRRVVIVKSAMAQLGKILKSHDISKYNKMRLVKTPVF